MTTYRIRRMYEEPTDQDGARVLVDRVWPRGISKAEARMDQWAKDLAPSAALRKWFGHDPEKFEEFAKRYRDELGDQEHRRALAELPDAETITFLYSAKDQEHNQAVVLRKYCKEHR